MTDRKRLLRIIAILAVTALALALRLKAVNTLPIDYDEDDYLRAGQQYAVGIQTGDWSVFTRVNYRTEHPPLTKIANAVTILGLPPAPEIPDRPTTAPPASSLPQPQLTYARRGDATFGTLEVLALAFINPLAGLFLGIQSWTIKYTSQVMLEALPALTSLLVVLFYLKSKGRPNRWLVLSGVMLGLTAASKYLYCVVGIAVAVHWLWTTLPGQAEHGAPSVRKWLQPILTWGLIAVVVFFAADPYLWPDPINRLKDSVLYHVGYAESQAVREAGFPIWQPFVWLFQSVPWNTQAFEFLLDFPITLLALLGVRRLWKKQPVFVIWLALAMGFLLLWPTKWPQYVLILTAPLALAATEGFIGSIWEPFAGWLRRLWLRRLTLRPGFNWASLRTTWRDLRRSMPWLLPGLIAIGLITLFPLVYQLAMSVTDFGGSAIRDGIRGGVWRALGDGLAGKPPVDYNPFNFSRTIGPQTVSYAGPGLLIGVFSGGLAGVLVFEVLWTVIAVGLQTALGLSVALALHRRGVRFAGWWRALFILPWAIPEFVGALVWARIFEPTTGSLSIICGCPLEWSRDAGQTLLVLLIGATWMGWPLIMLAASAGLKLLSPEVYDAAAIDGASRRAQFSSITWPLLMPLLVPAMIIRAIAAFNQFYLFVVMQTDYPNTTLATLSYYLFDGGGQYAASAVINVFTVAMLIVFILIFNRWSKAAEGVTYA